MILFHDVISLFRSGFPIERRGIYVDGWQAGVGIDLLYMGLGAGINEKDLVAGQIYSCRLWVGSGWLGLDRDTSLFFRLAKAQNSYRLHVLGVREHVNRLEAFKNIEFA